MELDGGNSPAVPSSRRNLRLGWMIVLPVLLLQVYSRYAPSPWAVFFSDDWTNYPRSLFYASTREAALTGLQDPNRPVSMAVVDVVFRLFGNNRLCWTALSLVSHSLMLWFIMRLGLELTGDRRVAAIQGLLFALLPNVTDTWQWSTQILNEVTCALLFYALSGWLWVAHVRRGGAVRLVGSVLAYAMALFSYESGIFLPAAYPFLLPWRREPGRTLLKMAPFALFVCLYAAWRMTNAFGLNRSWYYPPHMQMGFSWWFLGWNARQIAHWWIGDRFFGTILSGLENFAMLRPWTRRLLGLGNVLVVVTGGLLLRRLFRRGEEQSESRVFSTGQAVAFGLVWAAAGAATSLVSYVCGRLNYLPAIGITLLGGLLLVRWPWRSWYATLLVPAMICLAANQGMTEHFRQVGALNQRLFTYLQRHQAEWSDKEVLLFDTRSLRHRLTPGLLSPVSVAEDTWTLVRSYIPMGMVQLITRERPARQHVIVDVESNTQIKGDELAWHYRYDPSVSRRTPLDRVFVVDVWNATQSVP